MKGFMADIIWGDIWGCSLESVEAAVSESLEFSALFEASLFELLLLLLLLFLLLELLEDEEELEPPTRFWMKSCNRPHSTCLAGITRATRHNEQTIRLASFIAPTLLALSAALGGPILRFLILIDIFFSAESLANFALTLPLVLPL